ncbi:zinc dependent phospholipase C family protein [Lederbergia citrea]|uniref:zinc dependent phospholipase C family protein n=1 Tax=Lederbergia citrea TaxID=2833581 RepID=UPI003211AE31
MHLIIVNEIATKLSINDRNSFLLGGIAPDAVTSKDFSHFFRGDHQDFSRYIDYEKFLKKYSSYKQISYILGYYTHLIADDLWLKGFFVPWLKNRIENDKNMVSLYHNDFRLLNGKLLEYYGVNLEPMKELGKSGSIIDLEEVKIKDVKDLLPLLFQDMNYSNNALEQKLNVFTFDQIIGYIETSVEKSLFHIKPIINQAIHPRH